jgi:hypothetical protein
VTGAWSSDGVAWQNVGSIAMSFSSPFLAGLALTSHNASATATAVFVDPVIR